MYRAPHSGSDRVAVEYLDILGRGGTPRAIFPVVCVVNRPQQSSSMHSEGSDPEGLKRVAATHPFHGTESEKSINAPLFTGHNVQMGKRHTVWGNT